MKILIVGDFEGNTGPAIVNKKLLKYGGKELLFTKETNKIRRVTELIIKVFRSEGIIFSGISQLNIVGMILCKMLLKPHAYLMHGSIEHENYINGIEVGNGEKLEKRVLTLAPKIICVSENFKEWCSRKYPNFKGKFTYVYNGIDWSDMDAATDNKIVREPYTILSVGGGRPVKNIITISEAVRQINEEKRYLMPIKLIVIGKQGKDSDKIKENPSVEYISELPADEMKQYYLRSSVYIQNSWFETFGLAPLEALLYGNSILISKYVGAKGVINNLNEKYIIDKPDDVQEIKEKIYDIIETPNNIELLSNIDKEETSVEYSLKNLIKQVMRK